MRIIKLSEETPIVPTPTVELKTIKPPKPDWTTKRHTWKGGFTWEVFYKGQPIGFGVGKDALEAIKFVQKTHPELPV